MRISALIECVRAARLLPVRFWQPVKVARASSLAYEEVSQAGGMRYLNPLPTARRKTAPDGLHPVVP